jgi:hypothetical protein
MRWTQHGKPPSPTAAAGAQLDITEAPWRGRSGQVILVIGVGQQPNVDRVGLGAAITYFGRQRGLGEAEALTNAADMGRVLILLLVVPESCAAVGTATKAEAEGVEGPVR